MDKKGTIGRPSDYTKELGDSICEKITQGLSLRSICEEEEMPSGVTIFSWLRKFPEFLKQYELATEERTETQQEIILDIGDKAIEHAEEADPKAASAIVQAYKLKADNLKWSMSKMKPKKYGDKIDLTSGGEKLPTPIYNGSSTTIPVQIPGHIGDSSSVPTEQEN
jgi:hypothetical protein